MSKLNFILIIFVLFKISFSQPYCKENENNCLKCNTITNLCIKCITDNFFPDKDGGCEPKCVLGKNYCNLCNEEETLCASCEPGFYPDRIGACSYTNNCKTSYKGKCLTCINDYILVEDTGFCKSLNTEDLKNCINISNKNGTCLECKEGYFLNGGDLKCSDTEFCYESTFGICDSCIDGYYLDKKNDKCKEVEIPNCKKTLDAINCDECNDNYYLSDNLQCTETNMCSQAKDGKCIECVEKYVLAGNGVCTLEQNCLTADKDTGECSACVDNYYFDTINKKCKSNQENNEFIFCKKADGVCIECQSNYFLGEDSKCTKSFNCSESENGKCIECIKDNYFAEDGNCIIREHCKRSVNNVEDPCEECQDDYFLDIQDQKCSKIENDTYAHCLKGHYVGLNCIFCKENYYVNRSEGKCYDNTNENDKFYKCKSSDTWGEYCELCEDGYFLSWENRACSNVEACKIVNNGKCVECIDGYCLDAKTNNCVDNEYLEDVDKKFYIACNRTNVEGTKCEICLEGYKLLDEGYCVDEEHCEIKDGDTCKKCITKYFNYGDVNYYCYNSVFGCIRFFTKGCLKCENLTDLYECTECDEGFKMNEYGYCNQIN